MSYYHIAMHTDSHTTYSLKDLALLTGIEPRTIRSYIQSDLLAGPQTRGRNASYDTDHLVRLRAIKRLKDMEGHSLRDIRQLMMSMTRDQLRKLADEDGATEQPMPASSARSALGYIRQLKSSGVLSQSPQSPQAPQASARHQVRACQALPDTPPDATQSRSNADLSGEPAMIDEVLTKFESLTESPVSRQSKGDVWFDIPVTHDIRLNVRLGPAFSSPDLAKLERIADHLRELLLRRT